MNIEELEQVKKVEKKKKKKACLSCGQIVEYIHKSRPKLCPFCQNDRWDKDRDEFKLFHLQDEYLKTKDNKILGQMYIILKEYAKKLIVKTVKGKYFFKKEDLEIKAHDSANKIIEYFLTKPSFKIENSFGGYMNWPVKNVLYADKRKEAHDSLNCLIDTENELEDYLPVISGEAKYKMIFEFEVDSIRNNTTIVPEIYKLIHNIENKISKNFSKSQSLLFLIGVRNKLKVKSDDFYTNFFSYCGVDVKKHVDTALFLVYKYIKHNIYN